MSHNGLVAEAIRRVIDRDWVPCGEIGCDPDGELSVEWYAGKVEGVINLSFGARVSWAARVGEERGRGSYAATEEPSADMLGWLERVTTTGLYVAAPTTPPPTWGKIVLDKSIFVVEADCGCAVYGDQDGPEGSHCPAHSFADLVEGEKRLREAQEGK